jgi:hypothetical protein
MDWRCDSNSRAPALQAQSAGSNPSPTKKLKKALAQVNSIFLYLRLALYPKMLHILENIPCVAENVYSVHVC